MATEGRKAVKTRTENAMRNWVMIHQSDKEHEVWEAANCTQY